MSNSYVKKLIDQVRRETENTDVGEYKGISDVEILYYLNDSMHHLQSRIVAQHPLVFTEEERTNVEKGLRRLPLPERTYIDNKITLVELAADNQELWHVLDPRTPRERRGDYSGIPTEYIRHGGFIEFMPIPQSNYPLRLTYVSEISEVDLRRGKVEQVNLNTTDRKINQLILNTSGTLRPSSLLSEEEYICVVDRKGCIKMRNICINGVDFATGTITVDPSFVYKTGEVIESGDFIVRGSNTGTQADARFPKMCERYFVAYASRKLLHRDSSTDIESQNQELRLMEEDIISTFQDASDDVSLVPMIGSFWDWE